MEMKIHGQLSLDDLPIWKEETFTDHHRHTSSMTTKEMILQMVRYSTDGIFYNAILEELDLQDDMGNISGIIDELISEGKVRERVPGYFEHYKRF